MATYKGVEINLNPTDGMKAAAERALAWRREFGRGGTPVGVARARDIINGKELSPETVREMFAFFSRHEVDKQAEGFSSGEDGYPSAGRIAWDLWGGDAGFTWSRSKRNRLESIDKEGKSMNGLEESLKKLEQKLSKTVEAMKAEANELSVGDFVEWDSSGGMARGRIESIERDGSIDVPDADVVVEGTPDNPAALIVVYRQIRDGYVPSDVRVGHRFSTLTKIDKLPQPSREERSADACEHKNFEFEVKQIEDDESFYKITAYASTFGNVDRGNDRMMSGAFADSIKQLEGGARSIVGTEYNALLPILWQHNAAEPIGSWVKAVEDEKGLLLQGIMPKEDTFVQGRVIPQMRVGAIMKTSIGYIIPKGGAELDKEGIRNLNKVDLLETSLVTIPMNPQADITGLKKLDDLKTPKEVSSFLKGHGLSNKQTNTLFAKIKAFARNEQKQDAPEKPVEMKADKENLASIKNNLIQIKDMIGKIK